MRRLLPTVGLAVLTVCCQGTPPVSRAAAATTPGAPAPPGTVPSPDDSGDWVRPAKDYASTRFRTLDQITPESVTRLTVKGTFSTGFVRGHEAAPLVVNNTMYVVTPFPNVMYALDLTRPGAPLKWKYEPKPVAAAQGVACCDVVNRGAVYDGGTIFYNTLDNRTVALDAVSGHEKWVATLGDINKGETITMAPLVAKGKVFVGNSGGELGVRGWFTALNAADGTVAWRAYATGPDKDILIGSRFKPFYARDRGQDLGIHTWPGEAWKQGGGTAWGWVSYDPALNLVYYGTSNPGPWNADLLARDVGAPVTYTWWAQRRGFLRNTLNAGLCDVVLGYASGADMVLTTTPYYRSTYVFVTRRSKRLQIRSFDDPRLRALRVGVQLVGDDGANTPPAHALSRRGVVSNVVGYSLYGDYRTNSPPSAIVAAVARGDVDVATVWGPLAGYFAARQRVPLDLTPVEPQLDDQLPQAFDISMAVRADDTARLRSLNRFLQTKKAEIARILSMYHVPRLDGAEGR